MRSVVDLSGFFPPQRRCVQQKKVASASLVADVRPSWQEQAAPAVVEEQQLPAEAQQECASQETRPKTTSQLELCREALLQQLALEEELEGLRLACRASRDAILAIAGTSASEARSDEVETAADAVEEGTLTTTASLLEQLDSLSEDASLLELTARVEESCADLEEEKLRLLERVTTVRDAILRLAGLCQELQEEEQDDSSFKQ